MITVYTKPNCTYCVRAKSFLLANQLPFTEVVIGRDIMLEQFISRYPNVKTAPFIIIDGEEIGGYDQLTEFFQGSQKQLLTETRA